MPTPLRNRLSGRANSLVAGLFLVALAALAGSSLATASAAGRDLPAQSHDTNFQSTGPSVQLSKTVVNPAGDTITVTGTGFLPSLATGTRPPLAGQPAGTYIAFGAFATVWKPSASAPSSARPTMTAIEGGLRWAVPEAARSIVGVADSVTLNPDGSFTATLTVKKDYTGALADGNYGIYTYPGSGGVQPLYETFTPVTFATATATATATASPSATPTASATAVPTSSPSATATAAPASPTSAPATAPASTTAAPKPPTVGNGAPAQPGASSNVAMIAAGTMLVTFAAGSAVAVRRKSQVRP